MQINYHPSIKDARDAGTPIVALESTLITHGLPWPENLEIARDMESEVRRAGATPATVAILGGHITVGLTDEQLQYLAQANNVRKCSRRDLPLAIARGEDGATTVASTMIIAHMAGIRIFATGGIGGVHRDHPFDVSADLQELGRTPLTVVCAGAKAILDLPLTLEVLETQGVPVVGYGTSELPAFYTRSSGLAIDARCDTPEEVADIITTRDMLKLPGGILITVPVPTEDELPAAEAETAIKQAVLEANAQSLRGKEITPYLLTRVSELTGTASKRANLSLLLNNARIAAEIALALSNRKTVE